MYVPHTTAIRRALRMVLMTRLTWLAESAEGTKNDGDDGKGAAASSGRNAVIGGRRPDGERDGRGDERGLRRDRRWVEEERGVECARSLSSHLTRWRAVRVGAPASDINASTSGYHRF